MKARPSILDQPCAYRARFDEQPDDSVFVYGTAVHKAYELWRHPPIDPWEEKPMAPWTLLMAWAAVCLMPKFIGNREGENTGNTLRYSDIGRGEKELGLWESQVEPFRPEVLATEWPFSMRVGDHTIEGTTDAVDVEPGRSGPDVLVVADVKTGMQRYDAYQSSQLATYGIAAANHWNWSGPIRLEFRCISQGVRRWRYTNLANLNRYDAPKIDTLIRRWEGFEREQEFPRRRNEWCPNCTLRNQCPKYLELELPTAKDPLERWRELKLLIKIAEQQAGELKDAVLKKWPKEAEKEQKGVLRIGNNRRKIDLPRLLNSVPFYALREHGVISSASVSKLDKLVKAKPELAEAVALCVQSEENPYLKVAKSKGGIDE